MGACLSLGSKSQQSELQGFCGLLWSCYGWPCLANNASCLKKRQGRGHPHVKELPEFALVHGWAMHCSEKLAAFATSFLWRWAWVCGLGGSWKARMAGWVADCIGFVAWNHWHRAQFFWQVRWTTIVTMVYTILSVLQSTASHSCIWIKPLKTCAIFFLDSFITVLS